MRVRSGSGKVPSSSKENFTSEPPGASLFFFPSLLVGDQRVSLDPTLQRISRFFSPALFKSFLAVRGTS